MSLEVTSSDIPTASSPEKQNEKSKTAAIVSKDESKEEIGQKVEESCDVTAASHSSLGGDAAATEEVSDCLTLFEESQDLLGEKEAKKSSAVESSSGIDTSLLRARVNNDIEAVKRASTKAKFKCNDCSLAEADKAAFMLHLASM